MLFVIRLRTANGKRKIRRIGHFTGRYACDLHYDSEKHINLMYIMNYDTI